MKKFIKIFEDFSKDPIDEAKIPFQSKITQEEQLELESIKNVLANLKGLGSFIDYPLDDFSLASKLRPDLKNIQVSLYSDYRLSQIRSALVKRRTLIENKYKSKDEIKQKEDSKFASWKKQADKKNLAWEEKRDKENTRLEALTDRQKAINDLCDIKYQMSEITTRISNARVFGYSDRPTKSGSRYYELRDKMNQIKTEFNIKSDEIRRQK